MWRFMLTIARCEGDGPVDDERCRDVRREVKNAWMMSGAGTSGGR